MLGKAILLIFPLLCVAYSEICKPGAPGAFKVRLNIKKALGDKAIQPKYRTKSCFNPSAHVPKYIPTVQYRRDLPLYTDPDCCTAVMIRSMKSKDNILSILSKGQHPKACPYVTKPTGDKYRWNADEEFLFKAVMAFVMRAHINNTIQTSNILLCNVTQRVSFWFVVTSPSDNSGPIANSKVENAIRLERNRINSAFLLDDKTLEFVAIPPTLAPEAESSRPPWLIVFGVVVGVLGVISILFVVSAIKNKMKRRTAEADCDRLEDGPEPVETIEDKNVLTKSCFSDGVDNEVFEEITTF